MFYIFSKPMVILTDNTLFQEIFKSQTYRESEFDFKAHSKPFTALNLKIWSKRRQLNLLSFTSLINSNYIDKIMNSLLEKSIFTNMDQKCVDLNSYYYCRTDIKWLEFAFLFGVLYGVD